MSKQWVESNNDGLDWYLEGFAPEPPSPTKESQEALRQAAYILEADPLKYDWEEASARLGADSPATIAARNLWLAKKDEIRLRYPYPDGVE